jgi:hypothetical protein
VPAGWLLAKIFEGEWLDIGSTPAPRRTGRATARSPFRSTCTAKCVQCAFGGKELMSDFKGIPVVTNATRSG